MSITVEGYSGCGIRVVKLDKNAQTAEQLPQWILEKTSSSASYVPRLHKQIDKQVRFRKLLESRGMINFRVPDVLFRRSVTIEGEGDNPSPVVQSVTVGMAFEHHTDAIFFLGKASRQRIDTFISRVIELLLLSADASVMTDVSSLSITAKLDDIQKVCNGNAVLQPCLIEINGLVEDLRKFFVKSNTHAFPVGQCHGDLTLSNLLIQEHHDDRIVVIDFLDSFIETPLADLAKLSQDLYYGWTLRQQKQPYDRTRLFTIFRLFRERLFDGFSDKEWFQRYFRPFLIINQLRVLQYAKNIEDAQYLLHTCTHQHQLWQRDVQATLG